MQISESKLRKIIRAQLKEFRLPEKDLGLNLANKLSPQEVSKALDNALGRTHASGRKFHSAFLGSLNESKKQVVDMTDEELLKSVHELSMLARSGELEHRHLQLIDGTLIGSPGLEIIKSILLFTGGHVAAVRNPSNFDPDKNNAISRTNIVPDKDDYTVANIVMTKLASARSEIAFNSKIYRGIVIDQNVAMSLDPGIEFNNWPISSFTTSTDIADRFARIKDYDTDAAVFLIIDEPNFGCNIRHLSAYTVEDEYVLGKKLIIKSVDKPLPWSKTKAYVVYCRIKE